MLGDVGVDVVVASTRAIGQILTLPRLASQDTTGVSARDGDSSRRRPVIQAS